MATAAHVLEFMPVGFRFRPTDEELVGHYLINKLIGETFVHQIIPEIEVCKHEPWDLPAFSLVKSDDPEWFFFSPRDYKYSHSTRSNRATSRGFWKATGKDRNVKVRGSDEIIGTKKTLVFYSGRVPHGVKTNWVIHEYHAETFPVDKRTFVLCKLMKKSEKKEERMGALVFDGGEPSSHMASDYENLPSEDRIPDVHPLPTMNLNALFQTLQSADEVDLNLINQSPIFNEQERSFQFPPWCNSLIGNDNSSGNLPFETTEEEDDEFVNSILLDDEVADEDVFISEDRSRAYVNDFTPSESLRKVYYGSSDTDAEVVSAEYGYVPETSSTSKKNDGPMVCLLTPVNSSTLSSNRETRGEKKGRSFQDDLDTSSGDSTAARPLKINRMKLDSSASTLRTSKTQYQPRSAESVLLRAGPRRSQTQRKVSKAAHPIEAQKEKPKQSNRTAQVSSSRNTLKAPSTESSGVNGWGSFIRLETPSLSQDISPPSVYLINFAIGLFLFVGIVWEILSHGKFC